MTPAPREVPHRLLNDEEIKIWEAADRGTDNTDSAWRALCEKFEKEIEQDCAAQVAARLCTCPLCGDRCERMLWRTFGEEANWVSRCCRGALPPE